MNRDTATSKYKNPVYNNSCADPFVLKYRGEYWCYSTGFSSDGRCFPVLHSRDLVNWRDLPGAMEPLSESWREYWAPEVTYDNGQFLIYYGVGNGVYMHIRVAIAGSPAGPFVDSGRRLTKEEFAIDAHVFEDDDGSRYLFYATDFLTHSHVGTGTVCDRMLDAFTLAGDPTPVTLACYDWHVFDPQRSEKGGVRWHTIEGPFVLKNKGLYYQMFSAGNWKNTTYGVSYAVTDRLARDQWRQVADGELVLPLLRTIPGEVIGPGHNSIVRGPDNQQLFCVYHRWSGEQDVRVLAIDRLDWVGERMLVLGPTTAPQPIPIAPTIEDSFSDDPGDGLGKGWKCDGGQWSVHEGQALQESIDSSAEARIEIGAPYFILELSLRAHTSDPGDGALGIELWDNSGAVLRFMILCSKKNAAIDWRSCDAWEHKDLRLPGKFVPDAYHVLRVECNGSMINLALDGVAARWGGRLDVQPVGASLVTHEMSAAFSGFEVTVGWQDKFTVEGSEPAELGWRADQPKCNWQINAGELRYTTLNEMGSSVFKGPLLDSYELIINARLDRGADPEGCYGFYPAAGTAEPGPLLVVEANATGWCISTQGDSETMKFPLPDFDPLISQQFRVRKSKGLASIWWESVFVCLVKVPLEPTRIGLYAKNAAVGFDMVRVTAIDE